MKPRTDREGGIFTTTLALSNDERMANWYYRIYWSGLARNWPVKVTK